MGFLDMFREKSKQEDNLHNVLKSSFSNVRQDTDLLFQWVNYLNQKLQMQEAELIAAKASLSEVSKVKEKIREQIELYFTNIGLSEKLKNIEQRIDSLYVQKPAVPSEDLKALMQRLDFLEQKKQSLRRRISENIARVSKEQLKTIIISLIKKYEKISAQQLRGIIVDDKKLCSKSSFYRLLEEIEDDEVIGVIREKKEKHYLTKLSGNS